MIIMDAGTCIVRGESFVWAVGNGGKQDGALGPSVSGR